MPAITLYDHAGDSPIWAHLPAIVGFTRFIRSTTRRCIQSGGSLSPIFHEYTVRTGQPRISAIFSADQCCSCSANFTGGGNVSTAHCAIIS